MAIFLSIRSPAWPSVGRIQYAPTRVPEKMAIFLSIRPPAWPPMGRMQYALHGRPEKWRFFYPFDHRRGRLWGVCCCALHGRPKKWRFFFHSTTGVAVYGAYAVAPYTDRRKPGWFLVRISRGGGKGGGAWVVRKVG